MMIWWGDLKAIPLLTTCGVSLASGLTRFIHLLKLRT